MIAQLPKKCLHVFRTIYRQKIIDSYVEKRVNISKINIHNFKYDIFRERVIKFLKSLQNATYRHLYRYSHSCRHETLYASAYACMTRSLIGDMTQVTDKLKKTWIKYFDGFQDPKHGLFHDPVVLNEIYYNADWWGARHLALHMISAYTALCARPKYPFKFLEEYYSESRLLSWLNQYEWNNFSIGQSDLDNKIMNIGCLLQYQRDTWGDKSAGAAVQNLKHYLRDRVNPKTGIWGDFDDGDSPQLSRMVQFAYHLFPIYFFDEEFYFDTDSIVKTTIATQNRFGGFGVYSNSSACEDMDSIYILTMLYPHVGQNLQKKIFSALNKAFSWVLLNQVEEGGFVFRLNDRFLYGSIETRSKANEAAAFPTWFRTLSIGYMDHYFQGGGDFSFIRAPGYEFL